MNDTAYTYFAALLIDGSETDIIMHSAVLRDNNICQLIYTAASVDSAIGLMKALPHSVRPGIILLGLHFPEKNGFDFIDAFENMPVEITSGIRISILSAYLHHEEYLPLKNKYASHPYIHKIIEKPLTLEKMLE